MGIFTHKNTPVGKPVFDKRIASAQAFLENSAGELLIVKSGYKSYWSIPGGIVDEGETPLNTVQREVYEEVGINLSPSEYSFVIASSRRSHRGMSYQFVFRAEIGNCSAEDLSLQQSEIEHAEFVTQTMIKSNDREYGQIVQAWANKSTGYLEFESTL